MNAPYRYRGIGEGMLVADRLCEYERRVGAVANDRARGRTVRGASVSRAHPGGWIQRVRRAVGRQLIRLGEHIAAPSSSASVAVPPTATPS